jgi:hypothetical protein
MQIPNTTEKHCYIPLSSNTVTVFHVSGSSIFFNAYVLRQYPVSIHTAYNDIVLYICFACIYGRKWWCGVVMEKKC